MKHIFLFLSFTLLLISCTNKPSPDDVLTAAIDKINLNSTSRYSYSTYWDNRFNQSTFSDSSEITYMKNKKSNQGISFHVRHEKGEFIFDGENYQEIIHSEKTVIQYDTSEIQKDPNYFDNMIFFMITPMGIKENMNFNFINDTLLNQQHYYIFKTLESKPSIGDSTKTIHSEKFYYIAYPQNELHQMLAINRQDEDTLQTILHQFNNLVFEEQTYDFTSIDQTSSLRYRQISGNDEEEEMQSKQIKPGEVVEQQTFEDIKGNTIQLYGERRSKHLIMFSFIGCGGCEYAMREMRKKEFNLQPGLKLHYSSPVDTKSALSKYLHDKEFPFQGFSKESNMNDFFGIYSFPTFVLVNPKGEVNKVIQGYSEEVEDLLFGVNKNFK